jgi:PKD repeat protein
MHRCGRGAALAVALVAATATLSLASPAGAIVAHVGHHTYGVTPIKGVGPVSIPGAKRTSGLAPRNFDGPPSGGGPLIYHGGPVMHSVTSHVVYWDPNAEFTATTKAIVSKFFTDVAHDKTQATNVFAIDGQYTDATGNAAYAASVGTEATDATAYPITGNCVVPGGLGVDKGPPYTTCLTDAQLQARLEAYVAKEKLPTGPTEQYFLLLPHKVVTCFASTGGTCSNNVFCAYHSAINPGTPGEIIYSDIPFTLLDSANAKGCQNDTHPGTIQNPNGDTAGNDTVTRYADVALKYTSHEYVEAATDPLGDAWWDAEELENGDKCNGVSANAEKNGVGYDKNAFLPTLGGSAGEGTLFDQSINAHSYYLQSEWDNAAAACLMRPVSLSASFGASPAATGSPVSFSGTAADPYGAPGFTWSFGDGSSGAGASPTHAYAAAGAYTVTMTVKDALTGATAAPVEHTVLVSNPPVASFTTSANATTPGVAVNFDGSPSNPDGSIVGYSWSFGDGTGAGGAGTSHAYAAPGAYTATLTVTNGAGASSATSKVITVAAPVVISQLTSAPTSDFRALAASFNRKTGVITLTEFVLSRGTFSWLVTFQNGKFGVFAASAGKCKKGYLKLGGRCRPARVVFAKGSSVITTPGSVKLTIKPNASGLKALRSALKQRKALPVSVKLTFRAAGGGTPVSHTQALTLKPRK